MKNHLKDIEDLKLENKKIEQQSASLTSQTEQLDNQRQAIEENLQLLTEQLAAIEEISVDKEKLKDMKSFQQSVEDQISLLSDLEKLVLSKP